MDPAFTGYGFGLGFAVRKEQGLSAANGTPGDYYWSGVYGTYFWNDPVERMTVVAMIVAPGRCGCAIASSSAAWCSRRSSIDLERQAQRTRRIDPR